MLKILWLIPILPMAGFFILAVAGSRMQRKAVSALAVGPILASCIITFILAAEFIYSKPGGGDFSQKLGTWFSINGFDIGYGLYLDALSVVMTVVITFVASLIFIYSVQFMHDDEGYSRFFAYMYLFAA
jgi:NADH-quinone oxidoreductase subunit L